MLSASTVFTLDQPPYLPQSCLLELQKVGEPSAHQFHRSILPFPIDLPQNEPPILVLAIHPICKAKHILLIPQSAGLSLPQGLLDTPPHMLIQQRFPYAARSVNATKIVNLIFPDCGFFSASRPPINRMLVSSDVTCNASYGFEPLLSTSIGFQLQLINSPSVDGIRCPSQVLLHRSQDSSYDMVGLGNASQEVKSTCISTKF